MSSRFAKNFIWIWLFSLLVSTAGVGLESIYCFCSGKTKISLFNLENDCNDRSAEEETGCCNPSKTLPQPLLTKKSCCKKFEQPARANKSCCHNEQSVNPTTYENLTAPKIAAHNCCTKGDFKFFKLKTDFEGQGKKFQSPDFQAISTPINPLFASVFFTQNFSPTNFFPAAPPPALSGKARHIWWQSFLC